MNRERLQDLKAQLETPYHYTIRDILMRVIDALLEDDDECSPRLESEGWIEWGGAVIPPSVNGPVEVQFRDGTIQRGARTRWSWGHSGEDDDIVRYRPLGSQVDEETDTGGVKSSEWSEHLLVSIDEDDDIVCHRPAPKSWDSPPRVDRSLRGPCAVTTEDGTMLMYANDRGLSYYSDATGAVGDMPWDRAEESDITVRKLTPEDLGYEVRRWDQWTPLERNAFNHFMRKTGFVSAIADKAIEIATREVPHE